MARALMRMIPGLFVIGAASGALRAMPQAPPTQQGAAAEFEVATIKINRSGDTQTQFDMVPGSGRVAVINMQLRGVIQSAYRVPANQLVNVPDWVNSTRVDIIAKADPTVSVQQLQTMLQPLLVDRLKLRFHHESRDRDVYALVVASKDGRLGPNLKRSATDCAVLGAAPRNSLQTPAAGQAPACGLIPSGPGRIVARGFGMGPFISILNLATAALGNRQVVDETGLTGGFDIALTYTPEALSAAALANRPGAPPPLASQVDPNGPNLLQALQDQLGLRLEPKKVPLEIMVIDHIEPPNED